MAILRNGKNPFSDIAILDIQEKIIKIMNITHMRFFKEFIRDMLRIQKNKLNAIQNSLIVLRMLTKFTFLGYPLAM